MKNVSSILSARGLAQFEALRVEAIDTVTKRFYADHPSVYARFGERGREQMYRILRQLRVGDVALHAAHREAEWPSRPR